VSEAWQVNYELLRAFVAATGRWPSKTAREVGESRLGAWVGVQRQAKRNGRLTADRRAALHALGKHVDGNLRRATSFFGSVDEAWWINLDLLRSHVAATGRWPSMTARDVAERRLGAWVSAQRLSEKIGKLTAERRIALEALGEHFDNHARLAVSFFGGADEAWQNSFELLHGYVTTSGRWPSIASKNPTVRKLAQWVSTQRREAKTGKLTVARRAALESVGPHIDNRTGCEVSFFGGADEAWQVNFELLLGFIAATGRWPSKAVQDPGEKKLGWWVSTQRRGARAGQLAAGRRAALEGLGRKLGDDVSDRVEPFRS
jgi:Helicase associated domain